MLGKKALGPVVATSLLIIVSVIAVIGFQSWFGNYSEDLFIKTEKGAVKNLNKGLEGIVGNNLYFKNSKSENLTINKIEIDGVNCNIKGNYSDSIININIKECIKDLKNPIPEVVVYTDEDIYSMKEYFKEIQISNDGEVLILNNLLLSFDGGGIGENQDMAYDIVVDNNGNIYHIGGSNKDIDFGNGVNVTNDGNTDFYLVKYNSSGIAQFAKSSESGSGIGDDTAVRIEIDNLGNIYVIGNTNSNLNFGNGVNVTNDGNTDFYLVKYDSNGVAQFAKSSEGGSGINDDSAAGLSIDNLGNIYVVGDTESSLNFGNGVNITNLCSNNFYLVKYNSNGVAQFARTGLFMAGGCLGQGSDVILDDLNNIYVVGHGNNLNFNNGLNLTVSSFFLVKYNSNGVAQFIKNGTGNSKAFFVNLDNSRNIYISGMCIGDLYFENGLNLTNDGNMDFFLVKYNSNGVIQFVKSSEDGSGNGLEGILEIDFDQNGNFYAVGYTNSSNLNFGNGVNFTNDGYTDFFLVKYDSNGVAQFVKSSEGGSGNGIEMSAFLDIDNSNNLYITGMSNSSNLDFGSGDILFGSGENNYFIYRYTNLTN